MRIHKTRHRLLSDDFHHYGADTGSIPLYMQVARANLVTCSGCTVLEAIIVTPSEAART
jgi:hypothetical protein